MKRYMVGPLALATLVAGGIGWAAIPSNGESAAISGCYEKNTGLLRVIDVQAGKTCTKWEVPISWSQQGPKGDQGSQGLAGPQGVKGDSGSAGAKGDTGPRGAPGERGLQGERGGLGSTGPAGPKGDTGAGVVWRGDWRGGVGAGAPNYSVGDLVRDNGVVWIARQETGGGCVFGGGTFSCPPSPGEDDAVWQLFAEDGAAGEQGQQGAQGSPGVQGPAGPQGLQGAKGDTGTAGPQGPAGGVAGYEIVKVRPQVPPNSHGGGVAICPTGKSVVGGGIDSDEQFDDRYHEIVESHPVGTNAWRGTIHNGSLLSSFPMIYAICANA